MPIEITGQTTTQLPSAKEDAKLRVVQDNATSASSQQQTGKPSTLDTVSLTDSAALLQKIEAVLADVPVVDTQRVENIRKALANGTYEIDATRVAEKLLSFENRLK